MIIVTLLRKHYSLRKRRKVRLLFKLEKEKTKLACKDIHKEPSNKVVIVVPPEFMIFLTIEVCFYSRFRCLKYPK